MQYWGITLLTSLFPLMFFKGLKKVEVQVAEVKLLAKLRINKNSLGLAAEAY